MARPGCDWTAELDGRLTALRADGAAWAAIAAELGVTRWTAIERGRRIGVKRPAPVPPVAAEDPNRPPLPAGHARTWGLLTAGTVLDRVAYPHPVFE